jgi:Lrp/AsnC family transcriptional regulator, leucine-responsive regulatory protein
MKLSRTDKSILKILQKDGRISNADLAEKVGSSKTACWNRMNRLMEEGYITDVKAVLDPDKLELPLLVTIGVVLDRSTPESFAEFEKEINKISVVQECLLLAGEFDYWLKIRVKDIQSFNRLHAKVLLSLPAVRQLRTFFVLNEIKSSLDLIIE